MEIKVIFYKTKVEEKKTTVINDFIRFLQKKYPLESKITVIFTGIRYGKMTTGSRTDSNELKILYSHRMLIDVLRTLAHEWVHEYQHQILDWEKGPDIGGKNENHANIETGILMKLFQKEFPDHHEVLYNGLIPQDESPNI